MPSLVNLKTLSKNLLNLRFCPCYEFQFQPRPNRLNFFRQRRRDRPAPLHVFPDVLRLREPGLRPADSPQDAKLEAQIQILPLVSSVCNVHCQQESKTGSRRSWQRQKEGGLSWGAGEGCGGRGPKEEEEEGQQKERKEKFNQSQSWKRGWRGWVGGNIIKVFSADPPPTAPSFPSSFQALSYFYFSWVAPPRFRPPRAQNGRPILQKEKGRGDCAKGGTEGCI